MLSGRTIECNHCGRYTVQGAARIFHKILFFFCPLCWDQDRAGCNAQMVAVAK